ncbi:ATP-binding protein [Prolixibacteraceae bacterium Z1-6]|uniref:histidine kinase n=1 Tax=Draconibacterium aestuarii TaxID=2998507 RepID=A0A9X3J7B5_9BACT|nr:ATP-binding protein [Prolixibacteraceae bacterium Z1-6]
MDKRLFITFVFLSCLLLNSFWVKAQDQHAIDSIKQKNFTETNKTVIVDNYIAIADLFSILKIDSALHYINAAIQLSDKISYKKGAAKAGFFQAYYFDLLGNYEQAIKSLEKASELFIEVGDSSYLTGCYNNLGVLYSYGLNLKKSLEYYIKSINIGETMRDSFSLAESYSNVAGFYVDLKEYSSALKYFNKALEIDLKHNESKDMAISYLDVANINIKLHRYHDALENLDKAQALMYKIQDPYYKAILFQRFANYYKETGELDKANNYVAKSQAFSDTFDYPMFKADILAIKGEILLKQKKYTKSLAVSDSAIEKYNELNSTYSLNEIYENKAEAFSALGEHTKAYQYLQMANKEEEKAELNEIAEYLGKFEKEEALKEERTNLSLKQELENQKNENALIKIRSKYYFTINLSILLGSVLILALYLYAIKRKHSKSLESSNELINHQKDLIEKSYAELKKNESRLAKLNATKDKFFSIIAHDLKNPFNTLIGISELMISNPEIKHTEDFEEFMEGMLQTAKSGHDLLENLLQWSRSQIGNIQLDPRVFPLNELFASVASLFYEMAKTKEITISIQGNLTLKAYADYNMANFVVRNLINNAIKFSHKNSTIEVSAHSEKQRAIISIKDQGIGISPDTLDKLFKIEYSVQNEGTANEKGTGLGLILCKEFVEKNGGEIWVESETGKGSTFSFSLPEVDS